MHSPYFPQLLPAMVAKGKGAVINIASMGSFYPGPYLAEYIATKHYMHSFTEVASEVSSYFHSCLKSCSPLLWRWRALGC